MCGIAGIVGPGWNPEQLQAMVASQRHRGPDAQGIVIDTTGRGGLGHRRLSILDLSEAGRQPMSTPDGQAWIVLNGEIYNYRELRTELAHEHAFRTQTDTEVLLAAYRQWGSACLDRLLGMFAFAIWDTQSHSLFAARDRFGIKPFYYHQRPDGTLLFASEIKALHQAGVPAAPDETTWATYLAHGLYDHSERTFWEGIRSLPPGHLLTWQDGILRIQRWYDVAEATGPDLDCRPPEVVAEEYLALLQESVSLRFRSDVPVGINLSGGLDSSTLLGLVHAVQGPESEVRVFTFVTGDDRYDETPWVARMLERTRHPSVLCRLSPSEVPDLAHSVQSHQYEPFGGLPTLAYARIFEQARAQGAIVLLDGQGLDEQWAGYDYYGAALCGQTAAAVVQGTRESPVRTRCLVPEFRARAEPFIPPTPFADPLRDLQYRDARYTKMPRALRFSDRISMRCSTELREPFLDHRLFELALRQPAERKINGMTRKALLRRLNASLLPEGVVQAPKRPVQTPQREWLRGPLRGWATDCIEHALAARGGTWLDPEKVRAAWRRYCDGEGDNSFYIWQWLSIGLMHQNGMRHHGA